MINYLSRANLRLLTGTALVRLDFNTEDSWRMEAVVPTLRLLMKKSLKIVVMSHRGRPAPLAPKQIRAILPRDAKKFSLRADANRLSRLVGKKVIFIEHFDFARIKNAVAEAPSSSIFLLENLRFMKGEEKNDASFARSLASLGDFYINDAFAVDHRANASLVAITKYIKSYAGLELEKEISFLSKAIKHPKHPMVFIVGGAKVADKLSVIQFFKHKADAFLLGGGSANTIFALQGGFIGDSIADTDAKDNNTFVAVSRFKHLVLPDDYVWSGNKILDIGPKTAKQFAGIVSRAKTIIWSGSMGLAEQKAYARGSIAIARAIAKNKKAFSITGGGETVQFLKKYKFDQHFTFVSTGGGALLDFLAGKKLPGIEALKK